MPCRIWTVNLENTLTRLAYISTPHVYHFCTLKCLTTSWLCINCCSADISPFQWQYVRQYNRLATFESTLTIYNVYCSKSRIPLFCRQILMLGSAVIPPTDFAKYGLARFLRTRSIFETCFFQKRHTFYFSAGQHLG